MQNEASPSASQRMTSFALSANPSVSERESKQLDLARMIFRKRIDRSTSVNLRSARISGFERMREKKKEKKKMEGEGRNFSRNVVGRKKVGAIFAILV